MIDSVCRRSLFPAGVWPLDQPYFIHINMDSCASQRQHTCHICTCRFNLALTLRDMPLAPFPSAGPSPLPSLTPPSFILASSYTRDIMQIFVKSECDYVGGEMSVGMFATPLTLSAAALSWIPWLNFNRCSTMRIRQGDLALPSHCVLRDANELYVFMCRRSYTCLRNMYLSMLDCAAVLFSLTQPKGMSCPEKEKGLKNRRLRSCG